MVTATAEAAVDRTIVLRSGGESLVTIDGRRAASRRVLVVAALEFADDDDDGIVFPCGRTNELQLVAAIISRTESSLVEIIISRVIYQQISA